MRIGRKCLGWAGVVVFVLAAGFFGLRMSRERPHPIPARGGEVLTMMPLQTTHYLQKDPRWESETVGGSGETLGQVGCTLCSLAMALDYYGIKTTPKDLNDFFKRNDGYTPQGWLKWKTVSSFANGKVAMDYIGPPAHRRIDQALRSSQPVIAKIFINGAIPHWVLIVGKDADDYLMRDPLEDGKSVQPLSKYGSKIHAIRTLRAAD